MPDVDFRKLILNTGELNCLKRSFDRHDLNADIQQMNFENDLKESS